jgi:hypothetical protein
MNDSTALERQGADAFLKSANDDTKHHVTQALNNYRTIMANDYECPPIGVCSLWMIHMSVRICLLLGIDGLSI